MYKPLDKRRLITKYYIFLFKGIKEGNEIRRRFFMLLLITLIFFFIVNAVFLDGEDSKFLSLFLTQYWNESFNDFSKEKLLLKVLKIIRFVMQIRNNRFLFRYK